jgi:hypothetical protein
VIEYCYLDGDLDKALEQAAAFVRSFGAAHHVVCITTNYDDDTGWTVIVVSEPAS